MKRFLSFALTLALLSTFCVSALAAGLPVQADGGSLYIDSTDPSVTSCTVEALTGTEINSQVKVIAANANAGKLDVTIEDPINCSDTYGILIQTDPGVETTVTVLDDVKDSKDYGFAIQTDGSGAVDLTVNGDVEGDWGLRTSAPGTIQVDGDVHGTRTGINTFTDEVDIFVNGNVSSGALDASSALHLNKIGSLGIDGEVSGPSAYISTGIPDDTVIAVGTLNADTVLNAKAPDLLRFLIGTDDSSEATMNDITLSGSGASEKTLTGIDDKLFGTTKTVKELANAGAVEVTLAGLGRKIDSVSGMGSGITANDNGDGTFTLKFNGDGFLGGLNKLIIKLGDLLKPASAKKAALAVKAETVGVQGEGAEAFNAEQRAGFKVSAEFIERNGSDAQILLGDEEIPSGCFAVITLPDGSVGVLFSNSFMATLGAGEHVFRVVVGEAEFNVTVNVEVL